MATIRSFANSLNLTKSLILLRLLPLDPEIEIEVKEIEVESGQVHHHLGVYSVLDDSIIEQAISAVATTGEQAKIDNAIAFQSRVANIPGWATWTEDEALAWWDVNLSDAEVDAISSLAEAKELLKKQNTAIQAIARMLIAIRDKLWLNS